MEVGWDLDRLLLKYLLLPVMSTIADEKLQSASFHNNLVASHHMYNPWRTSIANVRPVSCVSAGFRLLDVSGICVA